MSGHSKWASIKHKKGANDAKRGKIFTMHAKMIAIAAKAGGDPEMNPTLRSAIDRAKADNVPNNNIDRAVKKGSGSDKDATQYLEITYEAMGPGGTAFMIDVITDNKNRSNTNVKTILTKTGGTPGSAAWKFDKMAFFLVDLEGKDHDEAELALIDCGADDMEDAGDGKFGLYSSLSSFSTVKKSIQAAGYKVEKDDVIWKSKSATPIDDATVAAKIIRLMDKLEEDDDVNNVYTDADISESVLSELG
ncbi:MAG: YebC/PmpR family DNA-binding regulatory protein [Oceanicoccus sp.]|jgi:YebC/PmpR family DNA-binding regulatory protein